MKAARFAGIRCFPVTVLMTAMLFSVITVAQVSVTTWHNDNWRTGQNTNETILTTTNVQNTFGLLCQLSVSGQVYAQPLVVHNSDGTMSVYVVTMQDMLYVFNIPANWDNSNSNRACSSITQPTGSPVSLLPSGQYPADCHYIGSGACTVINPTAGALGTPVIGESTLYVVSETQDVSSGSPTNWYHYLHAIDVNPSDSSYLHEIYNGPFQITTTSGFNDRYQLQRPGLLFVPCVPLNVCSPQSAKVYVAFSMMDGTRPEPSGWIFEFEAVNLTQGGYPYIYATTPGVSGGGGGIWQGGAGLAYGVDENSNPFIYFSTADGVFDLNSGTPPNTDAADTFVKIPANLSTIGTGYFQGSPSPFFTPSDQLYRGIYCSGNPVNDVDLGSAGTMLIPDGTFTGSTPPLYAVKSDKENYLWVMDRGGANGPGGYNTHSSSSGYTCDNDPGYTCSCSGGCSSKCPTSDWGNGNVNGVVPPIQGASAHDTHSTPAFWNGNTNATQHILGQLYFAPVDDQIYDYTVSDSCSSSGNTGTVVCNTAVGKTKLNGGTCSGFACSGYSATPSISSNGSGTSATNGIVWAVRTIVGNTSNDFELFAFDAVPDGSGVLADLYDTSGCTAGKLGPAPNFPVPTIANGLVFVGGSCQHGQSTTACPNGASTSNLNIFGRYPPGC
jgi:hypothetical protein